MSTVFLYGFNGTFSGFSEYDWEAPKSGENHDCLLFLYQKLDEANYSEATLEIDKYGFINVENLKGNSLKVQTLNTPTYRGFSGFYEGAIKDGSVLVYYPNT